MKYIILPKIILYAKKIALIYIIIVQSKRQNVIAKFKLKKQLQIQN